MPRDDLYRQRLRRLARASHDCLEFAWAHRAHESDRDVCLEMALDDAVRLHLYEQETSA